MVKEPITKKKFILSVIIAVLITAILTGTAVWLVTGGYTVFMPPIVATLEQNEEEYGEEEKSLLALSKNFWTAMEEVDEESMRTVADEGCIFVHIGVTCNLDDEILAYASGMFRPTKIVFHGKNVNVYSETAVLLTDCDYSLLLGGMPTTHHFAVTEVYARMEGEWKLVQFSFTALMS